MAGYHGISMSNNAVAAYADGKKPVSNITKEDIQKHQINEGITFFRWFVKKYYRTCEWHHSPPKYNITHFYDIESCCTAFKRMDIDKLKEEYRNQSKPKRDTEEIEDKPYYASVEYSISTFTGKRKYINAYAIVHKYWAYLYDNYRKVIIRKMISGSHFWILERYQSRPDEMQEDLANDILKMIN